MKKNNTIISYPTISYTDNSKLGRFIKIPYSFIKNICNKKNPMRNTVKVLENLEHKTNTDTIAKKISSLYYKKNKKSMTQIEETKRENISQKRHKPENKTKKSCKLLEEFANEFDDFKKKKLNHSYRIKVDLTKKNRRIYYSFNKNYLKGDSYQIENIEDKIKKLSQKNISKDNKLKKYQNLSAPINSKRGKNQIRKNTNPLKKINERNLDNMYKENKIFNPYYKEINLNSSGNSNKKDTENNEFDDIAQRQHGHSQKKNYRFNITKRIRNIKPTNTQINLKKKIYEFLKNYNNCSYNKINPKVSNFITKSRERKLKSNLNDFSLLSYNKSIINGTIQKSKNKNKTIISLRKKSTTNSLATEKPINTKKKLYYSQKLNSGEIFDYFTKKCRINLEKKMNDNKQKTKSFITAKSIIIDKPGKKDKNKKLKKRDLLTISFTNI